MCENHKDDADAIEFDVICKHCGAEFVCGGVMTQHQRHEHNGRCKFRCPKKLRSYGQQQKHMRFHTGERPFNYSPCISSFARACDLNRHQAIHTTTPMFECSECPKKYFWKSSLRRHMKRHNSAKAII